MILLGLSCLLQNDGVHEMLPRLILHRWSAPPAKDTGVSTPIGWFLLLVVFGAFFFVVSPGKDGSAIQGWVASLGYDSVKLYAAWVMVAAWGMSVAAISTHSFSHRSAPVRLAP